MDVSTHPPNHPSSFLPTHTSESPSLRKIQNQPLCSPPPQNTNTQVTFGAQLDYQLDKATQSMTIGGSFAPDVNTRLSAKISSLALLSAAFNQKLSPFATLVRCCSACRMLNVVRVHHTYRKGRMFTAHSIDQNGSSTTHFHRSNKHDSSCRRRWTRRTGRRTATRWGWG